MKLDFLYMRIPLIFIIASAIFSATVYTSSDWYEGDTLNRFYAVERAFNKAKRQFEEANRNRSVYEQYLANYLRLAEEGFVGEEQRLNWIELLQNLDRELSLPSFNYAIEAKKPATLAGIASNNNIKVYQSDMNLSVDVLHEGDFFYLFESLQKDAQGFYSLRECEFVSKINRNGPSFSPSTGNVSASCQLSWITVMAGG